MMTFESFITWLREISPLLDAMTAVGTIGAVIVALFLGLRRTRTRLLVSLAMRPAAPGFYPAIDIRITNKTDDTPMVNAFFYEIPKITPSRIYIPGMYVTINNQQAGLLPQRLTKEDTLSAILSTQDLARSLVDHLSKDTSELALLKQIQPLEIGCVTVSGKNFRTHISDEVASEIAKVIHALRHAEKVKLLL
jgi:hypothetical protein